MAANMSWSHRKNVATRMALLLFGFIAFNIALAQQSGERVKKAPPDYGAYEWSLPELPVLEALDVDGNGELDSGEIAKAPENLKPLDKNGDKILDSRELGGPGPLPGWLRIQNTIKVIDRDGDDQITFEELEGAVPHLRRADINGDWKLDNDELYDRRAKPKSAAGLANVKGFIAMMGKNDVLTEILPGADERQYEAYILYKESNSAGDITVNAGTKLLDPTGKLVHEWAEEFSPEGTHSYLLENGLLLRQTGFGDYYDIRAYPIGSHGVLQLVDWDGNVVWEYKQCIPNNTCLHHDFEPMPNGNILVTDYYAVAKAELEFLGRTPRKNEADVRWFERVIELKPNLEDGTTEIVWIWDSLDHMVQDKYPEKANYGVISENADRFDINFPQNSQRHFHFNSVDYHPELDQIVVGSVNHSEIYIIDHSTTTEEAKTGKGGRSGKGGRILFRWGNPAAYGHGDKDDKTLGAQHDAAWLLEGQPGDGHITILNNQAGVVPGVKPVGAFNLGNGYSSVVEIKLPLKRNGKYRESKGNPFQAEVAWEFIQKPLGSWHAPFASGSIRLPNGNTIIVNSQTKRAFEVTMAGEIVMDFQLPETGRPQKVHKIPADFPGLSKLFE